VFARTDSDTQGGNIFLQNSNNNSLVGISLIRLSGVPYIRFVDYGSYDGQVRIPFYFSLLSGVSVNGIYSAAANGYNRLNNNILIQWGTVSNSNIGYDTVTFPVTFNQLFSVVTKSAYKGSEGAGEERYIEWQNNAQFRTGHDSGGFNWIAVGI